MVSQLYITENQTLRKLYFSEVGSLCLNVKKRKCFTDVELFGGTCHPLIELILTEMYVQVLQKNSFSVTITKKNRG